MSAELDRAGAVFGALGRSDAPCAADRRGRTAASTATELAAELPISRQAVLKHLTALADAGLVDRERSGREVHYRLTPAPLSDAVSWMAEVGAQWDDRLAGLAHQLDGGRAPRA